MKKIFFEFEGQKFQVGIDAFINKAGSVIQLPDGRLVELGFWFIEQSPPCACGVLEVLVFKAEVAE